MLHIIAWTIRIRYCNCYSGLLLVADPFGNNRGVCVRDIHLLDASLIPSWYDRIRNPTRSSPWSIIEVSIEMRLCPECIDLRMQSWPIRIQCDIVPCYNVSSQRVINWNPTNAQGQSSKRYLKLDHRVRCQSMHVLNDRLKIKFSRVLLF